MKVKIKQGNEMINATIEMVDGVMVVSPKKEMFDPKDGDIVTVTTETGGNYTCFFKGCVNGDIYSYGGLNNLYNMLFEVGLVCCSKRQTTIYPATEEEKQKLFDKIKEEGYEWKADTKELVKLKWKPKYKEPYFAPFFSNVDFLFSTCRHIYTEHFSDELTLKLTRVFKTEAECQAFCNKLNQAIESVKP